MRTARPGLHPVLPARERAPDRQGLAQRAAGAGHTAAWARDLGRGSGAGRGAARVGRGARPLAARSGDRLVARDEAGRVRDRGRDEARTGQSQRCRRQLGADGRRAARGVRHLEVSDTVTRCEGFRSRGSCAVRLRQG